MKLSIRRFSFAWLLTLFIYNVSMAQLGKNSNPEKVVAVKLAAYTVEQNKQLNQEFSKPGEYKIIYTCIPAGIVLIESENIMSLPAKTLLTQRIQALNADMHFEILEGYTQSQAEEACSGIRGGRQ
ncbi:MAG: hypothetical protein JST26_15810 [Bacteroidetes bacterium]|nr:hypothetical protein [Bacteroidota bacterium]